MSVITPLPLRQRSLLFPEALVVAVGPNALHQSSGVMLLRDEKAEVMHEQCLCGETDTECLQCVFISSENLRDKGNVW